MLTCDMSINTYVVEKKVDIFIGALELKYHIGIYLKMSLYISCT